jgi:uncharacterized protein (DUF2147 family)|tara:strand:+ start:1970 stop:2389 length:420 start_codon:yes stop_codon:yes gene_type:complete
MKKIKILLLFFLFVIGTSQAQSILGKWRTIDKNGVSKCIVNIYEKDGKVYGKIVEVLVEEEKNALCEKCEGDQKNKPYLGLILIKDLTKEGKYYKNGTIFDPENGEEYRCRLSLENKNTLQVRGYLAFLYATQYWKRVI